MVSEQAEVGRYAPSPTGDLHLGNLRTAVIAWLHARLQRGTFLLRMEDLDSPRCVPGSAEQILRDLEWLGLDWDGEVVYQSERQDLYHSALAELRQQELLYPCFCSRKDIRDAVLTDAENERHSDARRKPKVQADAPPLTDPEFKREGTDEERKAAADQIMKDAGFR